jgi:hypothetical protein
VDAGPAVAITSDETLITGAVASWRSAADAHTSRAEAAALALADHEPVAAAGTAARTAEQKAAALEERLDADQRRLRDLTAAAAAAAATLISVMLSWTRAHPALANPPPSIPDGTAPAVSDDCWDADDIESLRSAEPGQVLCAADGLAAAAAARAAARAGRLRADAAAAEQHAGELRGTARELRTDAAALRDGKLLPLPRPGWAGGGNDSQALGSALDWHPSLSEAARPPLEAALADAGLLGATLTPAGAATTAWQVSPHGPAYPENLTAVLTADPAHPLAATAAAVLERVALTSSATAAPPAAALVIGRDGTFRAGVTAGAPALAPGAGAWPPAQHVGARQRREAALIRARELDGQAAETEAQAEAAGTRAGSLRQEATKLLQAAAQFPRRETLRTAEAARAAKAGDVADLVKKLGEAAAEARDRRRNHQRLRTEWAERTRSRGLPADPDGLSAVETQARGTARTLRTSAGELADRFAPRLGRLRVTAGDDRSAELKTLLARGTGRRSPSGADSGHEGLPEAQRWRRNRGDPRPAPSGARAAGADPGPARPGH